MIAEAPPIRVMDRGMARGEHRAFLERRNPVGRHEDPVTVIGRVRVLAPAQRLCEGTFRIRCAPAADEAEIGLELLERPELGGKYLDSLPCLATSGAKIEIAGDDGREAGTQRSQQIYHP